MINTKNIIQQLYKRTNNLIKDRFPVLSYYYYTKPVSFKKAKAHVLNDLIKGKDISSVKSSSIVFYTIRKSASQLIDDILLQLAAYTHHIHIRLGHFAYLTAQINNIDPGQLLKRIAYPQGYIYGPIRIFQPIEKIEQYNVVLLLRDPRDVLVSEYYSIRNTHVMYDLDFIRKRKLAHRLSIDEYVKQDANLFLKHYEEYIKELLDKPYVLFCKYEDMIVDFDAFLTKVSQHCKLSISEDQKKELLKLGSVKLPEKENQKQHIRKGKPGDHKEKLKPETIHWLNEKFKTVLERLNYQL